jgi:hypothetical protein
MVYRGVAPEMVDLLIDQQHKCAALNLQVSQQEVVLHQLEDAQEESQYIRKQARPSPAFMSHCAMYLGLSSADINSHFHVGSKAQKG